MMRLLILFLVLSIELSAQSGHFFLNHFSPETQVSYKSYGIEQDKRGVLYYATRSGLMTFDGREWMNESATGAVYAVTRGNTDTIYFGGSAGFGSYHPASGSIRFWSDDNTKNFYSVTYTPGTLYFLNDEAVHVYNETGEHKSTLKIPEPLTGLYTMFGLPYAAGASGKLYRIGNDNLVDSNLPVGSSGVAFIAPADGRALIGTNDSRLFMLGGDLKMRKITLQDSAYLNASQLVNGVWVTDQLIAVGTLRGGVMFVDPTTGRTEQLINYSTGLPDNEVYTLMCDRSHNVWVGHDYGFTRIAPYLPFRSFSHYEGLEGNVLCALTYGNVNYIGTSSGLYRLGRKDVYKDIITYETVNRNVTQGTQDTGAKGGIFGFLRKKGDEPQNTTSSTRQVRVKKVHKVLLSSDYAYSKVSGIDSKVSRLIIWKGNLIAAGLSGVFVVDGLSAKPILEQPVSFLGASPSNNVILFTTLSSEIGIITQRGNDFGAAMLSTNIREPIHYLFEGASGEVWLCGLDNVYRVTMGLDRIEAIKRIEIPNPAFDETVGAVVQKEVIFANSSGFYRIAPSLDPVRIDSIRATTGIFATVGTIWYNNGDQWKSLNAQVTDENMMLLSLLNDIRYISPDNNPAHLWLVTGDNELYKFKGDVLTFFDNTNPVFLKEIRYENERRRPSSNMPVRIDEEHSNIIFKAVLADFLNASSVAYRYKLQGLMDQWSEWSRSNDIPFHQLPSGEYTLNVQARNAFGKISEMPPAYIHVTPPYWRQPWFYAMEASVFLLLVILSFQLSTRFRIISRLLSLLTIILLIEFIQTAAGATFVTHSSPVTDFIIQVIVALLILPVEGFLRKQMLRSIEKKEGLYRIFVPGSPLKKKQEG